MPKTQTAIGAIDCSYISKSGKSTFGLDKFWSGVAKRTKRGLEISLVCIINIRTGKAWSLDVRQTPSGLSSKEGADKHYTRYQFELIKSNSTLSINSFIRKAYNTKFVKTLFDKLSSDAEFEVIFDVNHPTVRKVINPGQINY